MNVFFVSFVSVTQKEKAGKIDVWLLNVSVFLCLCVGVKSP